MSNIKRFLLMVALTAMWSPSFLFIKLAVQELPPMTTAAMRITLACVVFYLILLWKGEKIPKGKPKFWIHATVVGLFSTAIPFCLFCYAEQTIDSSLAAILNGTTPMFTALLAQLFIPTDRLNLQKTIGIALATCGLFFLFSSDIREMHGSIKGMIAATTAAFCYGVHHVYGKKYFTGYKPYVAPATSLMMAALVLWPIVFFVEKPWTISTPPLLSLLGVCGLTFFGTIMAFIFYYKLLEECGPIALSLVSCFFPVGGLLLGMLFLHETFTLTDLMASFTIVLGMCVVNQVVKLPFLEKKPG